MQLDIPTLASGYLAVAFMGTMVTFIILRKLGKSSWLIPHQGIIGVGVGWTVLTGWLSVFGLTPQYSPAAPTFQYYVFLPQQFFFSISLVKRKEITETQFLVTFGSFTAAIASRFLFASYAEIAKASIALHSFSLVYTFTFNSKHFIVVEQTGFFQRIRFLALLWLVTGVLTSLGVKQDICALAYSVVGHLALLTCKLTSAAVSREKNS